MVEVFTTNIFKQEDALEVIQNLRMHFPEMKINIDLEDVINSSSSCHSILRIEGQILYPERVIETVTNLGFQCNVLEDKVCAKQK